MSQSLEFHCCLWPEKRAMSYLFVLYTELARKCEGECEVVICLFSLYSTGLHRFTLLE